jgi:class 3 adenylate cyclase
MTTIKEIVAVAKDIFETKWEIRDGRKVPDTVDLKLGNDGLKLAGTILYSDMADSTALVDGFRPEFAAEMYKTYLMSACHVIRNNGGEITAFDGDRVMAVFLGDYKNTSAAKAALQIYGCVQELNVAIKQAYPKTVYTLRHSVGVDTSDLLVARTGIRDSNDLVWVGRAANLAAKLCSLGDATYPSHITEAVFNKLHDEAKHGGNPRKQMWEKRMWTERGMVLYRSSWNWKF